MYVCSVCGLRIGEVYEMEVNEPSRTCESCEAILAARHRGMPVCPRCRRPGQEPALCPDCETELRRIFAWPDDPCPRPRGGPFRTEELVHPLGTDWAAVDPETGIGTCARDTRCSAEEDARALNAAFELGRRCGLLEKGE